MAQTGSTGSYPIQSNSYDQLVDLLNNLPDNTTNDINAKDVRDSVFTLWDRLDKVSIIAGSAASASSTFINANPTTITVGGIPSGTTFPTVQTMQQMFDKLLYPYQAPVLSLSITPSQKEYGEPLSTSLGWSYTRKSNPITSVIVNGGAPVGPPATSGAKTANGTYSTIGISTVNTFTMSVTDNMSNITTTTTTLTWMNKIRWGSVNLSAISPSNPNLTTNPELSGNVGAAINSATINGLSGQLATSKAKVYNAINGNGNYLIFAWPTIFGGTPSFLVNNLPSTAFTLVKTNWPYTNSFGVVTNYEVWVSNTLQNSPLLVEVKGDFNSYGDILSELNGIKDILNSYGVTQSVSNRVFNTYSAMIQDTQSVNNSLVVNYIVKFDETNGGILSKYTYFNGNLTFQVDGDI